MHDGSAMESASSAPAVAEDTRHDGGRPFVRFASVSKTYDGETLVIEDLNLAIRRGEFLTLLGPSGSGKTTTLLMLAGFEKPTFGEILLDEKPLSREPAHRRNFGMVFQDYALFPHMTVNENVAFPLGVRKRPRGEVVNRVATALEMVKLAGFGDRMPNQLSGGQQQRVALARALVFEPRLVLMDEPLGALDKQLREQMQLEIKHIQNQLGITAVYVTHDQAEALVMSDRIAVFNDGEVLQLDRPQELYERPRSAFVAQFIGENNRLFGKVVSVQGEHCRVALESGIEITALAVAPTRVGDPTVLSIRPERLVPEPTAGCDNRLSGRLEEIIYLGDHVRLRLKLDETGGDLIAKVPIGQPLGEATPGRRLTVGWAAEHCRALDPG